MITPLAAATTCKIAKIDDIIRACMNGQLAVSHAIRDLKALGIPADKAQANLKAAWEGK